MLHSPHDIELRVQILTYHRLGNILLRVESDQNIKSITVIDWEYAMLGPSFVDVGWFLGETLLTFYETLDNVYAAVARSFMDGYAKNCSSAVDMSRAFEFCSLHMLVSLPQKVRLQRSRTSMGTARPLLESLIALQTCSRADYTQLWKNDPLSALVGVIEDHLT